MYQGDRTGFYELTMPSAGPTSADAPATPGVAARCSRRTSSTRTRAISRRRRRSPWTEGLPGSRGFHVGVRREMWIYLVIAAVLIAALEWATYHRRITV